MVAVVDQASTFKYQDLKEQIKTSTPTGSSIPISTALILFGGLPVESKQKIVNELMQMCVNHQRRPNQYTHEVAVTEPIDRLECDWFKHSPCSLPRLALVSGIHYRNFLRGDEFTFSFHPDESHAFNNSALQDNFAKIGEDLQSNELLRKGGPVPKGSATYWKQVLPNGLRLMNIWDIQLNRAVLHSLSAITGRLHESHSYLFVDLQADVPRLLDPPNISTEQEKTGDTHLMRYRSRLEYLVRSATVAMSSSERKSKACTIVAVHDGTLKKERIDSLCTKLQEALLKETKEMNLGKLIDQEILVLDYNSPKCSKLLKQHIDEFLLKLSSKGKFLPSWLFLLDTLKSLGKMFIKKAELEEMAKECRIVGDELEQMLIRFTAFGSVIYIPDIDFLKHIIILQPEAFVQQLRKLYSSEESKEIKLHSRYGILTGEAAEEIFGHAASTYVQILRSAQVSLLLPTHQVQNVCDIKTKASSVDYIPSVRVMPEKTTCDTSSLHLRVSNDIAPINTHVAMADSVLQCLKNTDFHFSLIPVEEANVTKFEIKSAEVAATITLVYQRNMYEMQLQITRGSQESLEVIRLKICKAWVDATGKRSQRSIKIKISFVVVCPSCHNAACRCDPLHIQCYLPIVGHCKRCGSALESSSPALEWRDAVEKVSNHFWYMSVQCIRL